MKLQERQFNGRGACGTTGCRENNVAEIEETMPSKRHRLLRWTWDVDGLFVDLSEQEEFDQGLLGVQAIAGFLPYDGTRVVEQRRADFFAAMRGQAM